MKKVSNEDVADFKMEQNEQEWIISNIRIIEQSEIFCDIRMAWIIKWYRLDSC